MIQQGKYCQPTYNKHKSKVKANKRVWKGEMERAREGGGGGGQRTRDRNREKIKKEKY